MKELKDKCLCLEKALKERYSGTVGDELQVTNEELKDLLHRQTEFIVHWTKRNYYCTGSKPSGL